MSETNKNLLPGLNGLRAFSILLVILDHIDLKYHHSIFRDSVPLLFDGALGVNTFFVISGFLITYLLLKEENNYGKISLKSFYIRRSLRIFPVYYIFLLVCFLLQLAGRAHIDGISWLTSLTYTKYFSPATDWETTHLWSLSVEEHFYLLWPFVFKYFKNRRNLFMWCVIVMSPIIRIIYYRHNVPIINPYTFFWRVDAIMWGCCFAVYLDQIKKVVLKYANAITLLIPFAVLVLLFYIDKWILQYQWHLGVFTIPFGSTKGTVADICIGLILILSVYRNGLWSKFLNIPIVAYMGILSYSIYIWQQLFSCESLGFLSSFPANIFFIFLTAYISYNYVEKPFLKLRDKYKKV
jgi:peptidoglycan/LPS O-acetylase OafA/YrhL